MRRLLCASAFLIMALGPRTLAVPPKLDDPSTPIDHIEEDWELVIEQPDVQAVGPQITTTMSPEGDNSQTFMAFNLNYRDSPFLAGGLQVQVWSNSVLQGSSSQKTKQLATPGETITWTQSLWLYDGWVWYDVKDGQSTTWGSFGSTTNLEVFLPTSLTTLNSYSPDVSAAKSGASWQGNHVTSLKMVGVRYYSNGSLVRTDSTARVIKTSSN